MVTAFWSKYSEIILTSNKYMLGLRFYIFPQTWALISTPWNVILASYCKNVLLAKTPPRIGCVIPPPGWFHVIKVGNLVSIGSDFSHRKSWPVRSRLIFHPDSSSLISFSTFPMPTQLTPKSSKRHTCIRKILKQLVNTFIAFQYIFRTFMIFHTIFLCSPPWLPLHSLNISQ